MAANNHPLRKRAEYGLLKSPVQMLCESSLHVEVEKGSQQAPITFLLFFFQILNKSYSSVQLAHLEFRAT